VVDHRFRFSFACSPRFDTGQQLGSLTRIERKGLDLRQKLAGLDGIAGVQLDPLQAPIYGRSNLETIMYTGFRLLVDRDAQTSTTLPVSTLTGLGKKAHASSRITASPKAKPMM